MTWVNLKLVFLSATPMYNNHNEIISLTNILNINDKRSIIRESEIFDEEGNFIEIQGTAEKGSFSKNELDQMTSLASEGIKSIIEIQKKSLNSYE